MKNVTNASLWIKIIIIHFLFILLHYLYDWFPNSATALFSGINESVYQHMKIGFFAYVIFALGELIVLRRSILSYDRHIFSRLFSASFFPFMILVIYLTSPLLFGRVENIAFEVIFANIALLFSSLTTLVIENQIEKSSPSNLFRIVVVSIFVLSLIEYIVFTDHLPWFDVFAIPPGY